MTNADKWLNECLLIEGGKKVRRKDVLGMGVYRTEFLRDVFNDIQRTVKVEIPAPLSGEAIEHYHTRVCKAARKSGATVITEAR